MDIIYYQKYLKYRNKFLSLKKEIIMNDINHRNIKGGANCHKLGYNQHFGECWHDALSVALLYSDTLSDYHQTLFDDPTFTARNIVRRDSSTFKEHLMPINIEPNDYELYLRLSEDYINSLHERYINDKHPTTKPPIKRAPVSPDRRWVDVASTPQPFIRQESTAISLKCVNTIYNISNINNVSPVIYTKEDHGGYDYIYYGTVATINYFLTSYNTNKYIEFDKFVIEDMMFNTISDIISNLEFIKDNILNSHAIILILSSEHNIEYSHAVSLITCNNIQYFYDDNGISDTNNKTLVEFNWKDELISRIDGIIRLLTSNTISDVKEKMQRLFSTSELDYLIHIFSDFLNGKISILNKLYDLPDDIGSIGKSYINEYYIDSMLFLTLKDIPSNITIEEQLSIIYSDYYLINHYNNKKTIDFIKYDIARINYDNVFKLFMYCLTLNNATVADIIFQYIINNFKGGINVVTSDNKNLLFAFLHKFIDEVDNNNIELKELYINQVINRNIKFTTKDSNGMDFLTYINKTEYLKDDIYINKISGIIISAIMNKILKDTPSLAQFYSILNHPFFKNIAINKPGIVRRYKDIHKIK